MQTRSVPRWGVRVEMVEITGVLVRYPEEKIKLEGKLKASKKLATVRVIYE